jgi:glycosyltransferase involved in cell wall biosynthesis
MKIAIPICLFDHSGGVRVLSVLANGLADRGYRTSAVVPRGCNPPFFPLNERVEIEWIGKDWGNLVGIKKVQLMFGFPSNVDVGIANVFLTAYAVKLARLLGRTRRGLYFIQGYEPLAFGEHARGSALWRFLNKKLAEWTYHLGLECVANSKWTAAMLKARHDLEVTVVPLGVDTKVFHPVASIEEKCHDELRVMTIGNAHPVKRFDLFLKVVQMLRARANCRAIVASHDKSLVAGESFIEFLRPKNDLEMAGIYNKASVFISTSISEGFGLPLLEAMACGTPVVTTDSGGIRDFCQDGFNCRIVESARPEDLAEAVMEIHSNKELKRRLIENGLTTARQWPWERFIDSFDVLLQRPNPAYSSKLKET